MNPQRLIVLTGPQEGTSAEIGARPVLVGRGEACDIVLTDVKVSRQHARLSLEDGSVVVADLESSNGTFVDGERVEGSTVVPSRAELRMGDTVLVIVKTDHRVGSRVGRYDLLGLIGEGGMASVYLARHLRVGHIIAVKMLSEGLRQQDHYRARFEAEWKAAAAINHPNILSVFDGDDVGGEYYLAMPYVRGADLATLLEREGALDPGRALAILKQVASALDSVHSAAHLVHRDVKPANILVANGEGAEPRDRVFLCDFGITKNATSETSGLTPTGKVLGTVHYMSPEQIQNEGVDPRTDVYALGCVAYACLTGSPPFVGDEMAVMYGHVNKPRPLVSGARPGLGPAVDATIVKAMAVEREQRFDSCGALVDSLRDALSGAETGPAQPAGADPDRTVARRRHEPPPVAPEGRSPSPRTPRVAALVAILATLATLGWLMAVGVGDTGDETDGRGGEAGAPILADPDETTAPDSPPRIERLRHNHPRPVQVQLVWSSSGDVSEITVYRNGSFRGRISPTLATFRDQVRPDTTYTYTVVLESDDGASHRRSIEFHTRPLPPHGRARLAGAWRVRHTFVTETYIGRERGDVTFARLYFSPKCPSGACDTKLELWGENALRFGLVQAGTRYRGGTTARYNRCGKVKVPTTFKIELNVKRARHIAGRWRATQFRGTLERSYPSGECEGRGSVERLWGRLAGLP